MAKLNIMIGVPGSGKDHFILYHKEHDDVVVSSDDIREELGDVNDQSRNAEVFEIFYDRIEQALKAGKNVWVNATNVTRKNRERAIALGKQYGYEIHAILMYTSTEMCIKNDALRDRTVGEAVIRKFERRFENPSLAEGFDMIWTALFTEGLRPPVDWIEDVPGLYRCPYCGHTEGKRRKYCCDCGVEFKYDRSCKAP